MTDFQSEQLNLIDSIEDRTHDLKQRSTLTIPLRHHSTVNKTEQKQLTDSSNCSPCGTSRGYPSIKNPLQSEFFNIASRSNVKIVSCKNRIKYLNYIVLQVYIYIFSSSKVPNKKTKTAETEAVKVNNSIVGDYFNSLPIPRSLSSWHLLRSDPRSRNLHPALVWEKCLEIWGREKLYSRIVDEQVHCIFFKLTNGTRSPFAMIAFISSALSDPELTSALNKSPVDKWQKPYFSTIFAHCVPFPLPGPPGE